jgi:hypothetical protein
LSSNNEVVVKKFKNSSGTHYLKALFYEIALEPNRDYVLYTLKQEDHNGYPSIHRLFVEANDPTEYEFAKKYFASWSHWKMVRECSWFKPSYEAMKEELEMKIRSNALRDLRESSEDPKNTVQVNKYLLDRGWADKTDTRGRPSKQKIKEEADKLIKENDVVENDFARIISLADAR